MDRTTIARMMWNVSLMRTARKVFGLGCPDSVLEPLCWDVDRRPDHPGRILCLSTPWRSP